MDKIQPYLMNQKIIEIKTKIIRNRYSRLIGKNAKRSEHGYGSQFMIHEITTNEGVSGWGIHFEELVKQHNTARAVNGFQVPDHRPLIGKSLNELFNPMIGVISSKAMYLDFALHDVVGNTLKQPVYQMVGTAEQLSIPCYDGMIYMDDISPSNVDKGIDIILENCRLDYALGFRAFKIKIGRGNRWMDFEEGLKRDIVITEKVREHFPNCDILVDANDGYTIDGFLRYFDAVADCNLFWIEEPFKENREDLYLLKEQLVKRSPHTLIADGETDPDIDQLFELSKEKLVDVLLMDIVESGFTQWRSYMPKIIENKILASPHNYGLNIKTCYSAHLAAGFGNVLTLEGVPDITEGVNVDGYILEEGLLKVPGQNGFGMELIWGKDIDEY